MSNRYLIMDITCGDLVGDVYDFRDEAVAWIESSDEGFARYDIIEE